MGLLNAIKTRGLLWVTVHTGFWFLDRYIELVLYPKSMLLFGNLWGVAVMMVFSLLLCWILISFYDWISTVGVRMKEGSWLRKFVMTFGDALGFETLKQAGEDFRNFVFKPMTITPSKKLWGKVANLLKHVWNALRRWIIGPLVKLTFQPMLFLYASVVHDPMTCLILLRPVNYYRMGKGEWAIFIGSVIVSCGVFGLFVGYGMSLIQTYIPGVWPYITRALDFLTFS